MFSRDRRRLLPNLDLLRTLLIIEWLPIDLSGTQRNKRSLGKDHYIPGLALNVYCPTTKKLPALSCLLRFYSLRIVWPRLDELELGKKIQIGDECSLVHQHHYSALGESCLFDP